MGLTINELVAYATEKLHGGWSWDQTVGNIKETLKNEEWPPMAIDAMIQSVSAQLQQEQPPERPSSTTMMEMMQRMMDRINTLESEKAAHIQAAQANQAATNIAPKKRYPDPEPFDGTRSKYQGWKFTC